ncbi:MAG: hypothetical protein A2W22_00315 [Candidatus Levybacteria bacterium RBG_16_35_11]|nr:MAG: hypothetical protein A2W22_00315 [Candidatus Levybacteria bacterium RBG_16_35_11]
MSLFKKTWTYLVILIIVLSFFAPVFKGQIPFPGDYLINQNPYGKSSFLGYAPAGYPTKGQGIDVVKEIYPWRYFSINQLKIGEIPFWNPYNFSGNPQAANFQTAAFYPLNFFYFLVPFDLSWSILIMIQPLLAGFFMFLFLNRGLKLSNESAVLGAISFGLSSYMTVWLEYGNIGNTFMWLPLILYLIKKISAKNSVLSFILLTFSFVFSLLAGYIQGFFYVFAVSFLFLLFTVFTSDKKNRFKTIFIFFSSFIVSLMLTSFQLLSTYQIFQQSTRGSYSLSQFSNLLLPPYYLITFFFSDFFGNQATRNYWLDGTYIERVMYVGVAFSFFVFYAVKKVGSKEKLFFLILGAVSLIVATNFPLIKYLYLIPIPVISTTVPTRELSVFIFSTIVLGAMGVNFWQKNPNKSRLPIFFLGFFILIILGEFIAYALGYFPNANFRITLRNSILPFTLAALTIFTFYFKKYNKKVALTLLFLIIILDLSYFFNKITPFSPKELIYPQTPVVNFLNKNAGINRFWGYGSAYISPNFQTVDKTYSPEGNDPLHIVRYGELLASSRDGKLPEVLPRPDANVASGFGKEDLKSNFFRKRTLDLLGVKYILNESVEMKADLTTFPEASYSLVWQKSPFQIYENKAALPRFFLANNYAVKRDKNDILNSIYDKNLDLRKTLILEEEPKISINKETKGSVSLISYKPNQVEFKTKSNGNSLLFLSDNYFPGWEVRMDGKKWHLQRANYTFRAVPVPEGEHAVIMNYSPQLFNFGLKIGAFGLILLILMSLGIKFYEKKS